MKDESKYFKDMLMVHTVFAAGVMTVTRESPNEPLAKRIRELVDELYFATLEVDRKQGGEQ